MPYPSDESSPTDRYPRAARATRAIQRSREGRKNTPARRTLTDQVSARPSLRWRLQLIWRRPLEPTLGQKRHIFASALFSITFRLRSLPSHRPQPGNSDLASDRRGLGLSPGAGKRYIFTSLFHSVRFRLRSLRLIDRHPKNPDVASIRLGADPLGAVSNRYILGSPLDSATFWLRSAPGHLLTCHLPPGSRPWNTSSSVPGPPLPPALEPPEPPPAARSARDRASN